MNKRILIFLISLGTICFVVAKPDQDDSYLSYLKARTNSGVSINDEDYDGEIPLIRTASNNYLKSVKFLLDNNADVDIRGAGNYTALMHAAGQGLDKIIELLHDHGANMNAQNIDGHTALMIAAENGLYRTVELLLLLGANKAITSLTHQTALDYAIANLHEEIADLLEEYKSESEPESEERELFMGGPLELLSQSREPQRHPLFLRTQQRSRS